MQDSAGQLPGNASWPSSSPPSPLLQDPCDAVNFTAAATATAAGNATAAACRDQLRQQPLAASTGGAAELTLAAWLAIGLAVSLLIVSGGVAAALIYKRRLQNRRKKLRASSLASSLSGDAITMQQVAAGRSVESLDDPAHYDQDWFLHSLENALFAARSCSSDSSLALAASAGPPQTGGHLAASAAAAASSRLHARSLQAPAAAWARA